jgi:hypothetical protein
MNALTAKQIDYLDHFAHKDLVELGTVLDELQTAYGAISSQAAPVNAVAATKSLAITGVVLDGDTVSFNNPLIVGADVYEFCADEELTVTSPNNIPVDITDHATKASGTLTMPTSKPTADDTMTIGTKVYTFVTDDTAAEDGEINIGTNLTEGQDNIVAAINGTDGVNDPHPLVSAAAFNANVCTITALVGGTAGNSIATTESFTAVGNVFGAGTLESGTDCSAANAITHLVAEITAEDTQGVGAVDGAGDTIDLTADTAGIAGNNIALAETLTNGAFAGAATKLSGGVDGTIGLLHEMRSDNSYIYVCIGNNTVAGANWRRFSIGSVY